MKFCQLGKIILFGMNILQIIDQMDSNQDYDPNLVCPICLELARNAVQSQCCGHLFCQRCVGKINLKFRQCPCCKSKQFKAKQSKIARRMISGIKVLCPNQCQKNKFELGDIQNHLMKCPLQPIKCIFCSQTFKRNCILQHTKTEHQEEIAKKIIQMHIKKQQEQKHQDQDPYIAPKINKYGVRAELGQTGKYYCGSKLIGKCKCCNGDCGPTNGQNCDACMELDVKRFNLAKGYLINPSGIVCVFNPRTKHFNCGRTQQTKHIFGTKRISCLNEAQCGECSKVDFSIQIGRYKDLI